MRGAAVLVALWALVPLGGCASRSDVDLKKLKEKLDEMAQDQSHSLRRIEELNNRIFLLEDKVDTGRVAMEGSGRRPSLPVIRLRPTPTPDPADADPGKEQEQEQQEQEQEGSEPAGSPPGADPAEERRPGRAAGRSVVEDRAVAYSGEARKDGPRPLLRLYGSSSADPSPRTATAAAPPRGPDPSTVTEKLDVMPLPRRTLVRKLALAQAKAQAQAQAQAQGPGLVPMRDYESARKLYEQGQYSAAAAAFRSFVGKYTNHSYADNALYWLGECFYDLKNYRLALKIFRRVIEEYPSGNKAPDSLLKMAYSYIKLEEKENAAAVLAQLVESFPRSPVARLASQTLVKIQ